MINLNIWSILLEKINFEYSLSSIDFKIYLTNSTEFKFRFSFFKSPSNLFFSLDFNSNMCLFKLKDFTNSEFCISVIFRRYIICPWSQMTVFF